MFLPHVFLFNTFLDQFTHKIINILREIFKFHFQHETQRKKLSSLSIFFLHSNFFYLWIFTSFRTKWNKYEKKLVKFQQLFFCRRAFKCWSRWSPNRVWNETEVSVQRRWLVYRIRNRLQRVGKKQQQATTSSKLGEATREEKKKKIIFCTRENTKTERVELTLCVVCCWILKWKKKWSESGFYLHWTLSY